MLRKFLLIESLTKEVHKSLQEAYYIENILPSEILAPSKDKPHKKSSIITPEALVKFFPGLGRLLDTVYDPNTYDLTRNNRLKDAEKSTDDAKKLAEKIISKSNLPDLLKGSSLQSLKSAKELSHVIALITALLRQGEVLNSKTAQTVQSYTDPNIDKVFDLSTYKDSTGQPLTDSETVFEIKRRIYELANLGVADQKKRGAPLSKTEINNLSKGVIIQPYTPTGEPKVSTSTVLSMGGPVVKLYIKDVSTEKGAPIFTATPYNDRTGFTTNRTYQYTLDDLLSQNYGLPINYSQSERTGYSANLSPVFALMTPDSKLGMKRELDAVKGTNPQSYFEVLNRWIEKQLKTTTVQVKSVQPSFFRKSNEESDSQFDKRIEVYKQHYDDSRNELIAHLTKNLGEDEARLYINAISNIEKQAKDSIMDGRDPYIFTFIEKALEARKVAAPINRKSLPGIGPTMLGLKTGKGLIDKSFEEEIFNIVKEETVKNIKNELKDIRAGEIAQEALILVLEDLEYTPPVITGGEVVKPTTFLGAVSEMLDELGDSIIVMSQNEILLPLRKEIVSILLGNGEGSLKPVYQELGLPSSQAFKLERRLSSATSLSDIQDVLREFFSDKEVREPGVDVVTIKENLYEIATGIVSKFLKTMPEVENKILADIESLYSQRAFTQRLTMYLEDLNQMFEKGVISKKIQDSIIYQIKNGFKTYVITTFNKKSASLFTRDTVVDKLDGANTIHDVYLVGAQILGSESGTLSGLNAVYDKIRDYARKYVTTVIETQTYSKKLQKKLINSLNSPLQTDSYLKGVEEFVALQFPASAPSMEETVLKIKAKIVDTVRKEVDKRISSLRDKGTLRGEPLVMLTLAFTDPVMFTLPGLESFIVMLTGTQRTGLEDILYAPGDLKGMKEQFMDLIQKTSLSLRQQKQAYRSLMGTGGDLVTGPEGRLAMAAKSVSKYAANLGLSKDLPLNPRRR